MTTQVITYNVQKALHYREVIAFSLISTIIVAAAAYVFFVQAAVQNVVARQAISTQINAANMKVNDLESKYLILDNSITMNTAIQYGFQPAEVSQFISASSLGQAHPLANNEF